VITFAVVFIDVNGILRLDNPYRIFGCVVKKYFSDVSDQKLFCCFDC